MKCEKCGNELGVNDLFCTWCGNPVNKSNNVETNSNEFVYNRPVSQLANNNGGQTLDSKQVNSQSSNMNYGQSNNINMQNFYNKQQKDDKIFKKIMIVISILLGIPLMLVLVGVVIGMSTGSKSKLENDMILNDYVQTNSTVESIDLESNYNSSSNGAGTITINTSSPSSNKNSNTYKVNYNGFKFSVPDNLLYEIDYSNDCLNIGDTGNTWVASLSLIDTSYNDIKEYKDYLSSLVMLSYPGANVSDAKVEILNGVEYILFECDWLGTNWIVAIVGLNSMYSAMVAVQNENNDFDRSPMRNMLPIISSAEYTGSSTYMKSNENIKFDQIKKALEQVLKEE